MEKPFPAYLGDQSHVFVCYAHEDSAVVYREMEWLHEHGVRIWYDEGISAGKNWRLELGDALLGADLVLFFVSHRSLQSEHCNREINLALDEAKTVVPIYLESVDLTSDLKVGLSRVQALRLEPGMVYRQKLLEVLEVDSSTASSDRIDRIASASRLPGVLRIVLPLLILVAAVAWLVLDARSPPEAAARFSVESLAVLPFRDRSRNADLQWLADGIASDLTVRLQATAGVRVPSQSAVERFRNSVQTPADIAQELDVQTLLNGYVNGTEDEVKVVIEVVDPTTSTVLWTADSSGGSDDLMSMQRSLVTRTSRFLGLRVEQPGRMELPVGAAAYQAFLKYMYFEATGQDHERQEWIEQTLLLEPDFAYGHLQAAWTYQQLYSLTNVLDLKDRARESLLRAQSLGLGDDPQWQNAWGGFLSRVEGKHAEAEPVLRRAAAEGAITQYAHLLLASGLVAEAAQAVTVSTARYPYGLANWGLLGAARGLLGDGEGMLHAAEEMLLRSPNHTQGHVLRVFALLHLKQFDEAETAITSFRASDPSPPGEFLANILTGYLYAVSERPLQASAIAEELAGNGAPMTAGLIYIAAGDPRGDRLFGDGRPPFFINLPYYLVQLPPEARSNPVIRTAIENYGYTSQWRLELCERAAGMAPETGITCVPGDYTTAN